jgi:hypothetical protein
MACIGTEGIMTGTAAYCYIANSIEDQRHIAYSKCRRVGMQLNNNGPDLMIGINSLKVMHE